MRFEATEIPGVLRVEAQPHADDRGLFARLQCPAEQDAAGAPFAPRCFGICGGSRGSCRNPV